MLKEIERDNAVPTQQNVPGVLCFFKLNLGLPCFLLEIITFTFLNFNQQLKITSKSVSINFLQT